MLRLIREAVAAFDAPIGLALQEPDLGIEAAAHLRVAERAAPHRAGVVVVGATGIVGAAFTGGRIRAREEGEQAAVGRRLPRRIDGVRAVEVVGRRETPHALPVHEDAAEIRAADFALQPHDREVVGGRERPAAPGIERLVGLQVQQSDVGAAELSAQPRAPDDVDRLTARIEADAAREEQVDRLRLADLEQLRVLEKERPLLGEEQREAGQVDLLLVGFDLGEVGVDRGIERQVGPHPPLRVEPDAAGAIDAARAERSVVVDRTGHVRNEPEIPPRRQVEAVQLAARRDAVERVAARHRREEDLLVLAADVTHHVDAPGAVRPRVVPQRPERDRELGFPAPLGRARAHDPVGVPVDVEPSDLPALGSADARDEPSSRVLALAHDLAVELDPEGVRPEDEGVLAIVERVEKDLDRVGIREAGIAAALADDDVGGRRVVADDRNIEIAAIDQEPDFSAFGGRLALLRLLLDEGAVGLRRAHSASSTRPSMAGPSPSARRPTVSCGTSWAAATDVATSTNITTHSAHSVAIATRHKA